jgi:hypothetical protein
MVVQERLWDRRPADSLLWAGRTRICRHPVGSGRLGGRRRLGDLDPRDPTGALGFIGVMGDLKTKTAPGGTLYVFALPKS